MPTISESFTAFGAQHLLGRAWAGTDAFVVDFDDTVTAGDTTDVLARLTGAMGLLPRASRCRR